MSTISFNNLDGFIGAFEDVGWIGMYMQYKATHLAAIRFAKFIKTTIENKSAEADPWTDRTGALKGSVHLNSVNIRAGSVRLTLSVGTGVDHTKYVECWLTKKARAGDLTINTSFGDVAIIGYFAETRNFEDTLRDFYEDEFAKIKSRYATISPSQAGALAREAKRYHKGKWFTV